MGNILLWSFNVDAMEFSSQTLIVLIILSELLVTSNSSETTVSNGLLIGQEIYHDSRVIYAYKGIPYAEPPIGNLRFKLPEPSESWEGTFNASKYGASCLQTADADIRAQILENLEISEDCLTLNVFTPGNSSESPLAIMVWIHGGGFIGGEGQFYDPRNLVSKGDVIAVTINYRLGPFGFLGTGGREAPGNLGIWDQLLAIRWVKDNAAAFNGDPERITIFGGSAGAWSVSVLVRSPLSKGLFQRAISQSGILIDEYLTKEPLKQAQEIAQSVGCPQEDESEMVECLLSVSAIEILSAGISHTWNLLIDGELLPTSLSELIERDDFGDYDYMIGFNELEGFLFTNYMGITQSNATINPGISLQNFKMGLEPLVEIAYSESCHKNLISEAILQTYLNWEDAENDQERLVRMVEICGDSFFAIPSIEMATGHNSSGGTGTTYLFYFTYWSENPTTRLISSDFSPLWNNKPTHTDELPFLFTFPPITLNEEDGNVSAAMIRYWSNFAKSGDPNLPTMEELPEWREYGKEGNYLEIANVTLLGNDFIPEIVNLWSSFIPSLLSADTCSLEISDDGGVTTEKNGLGLTLSESETVIWINMGIIAILLLFNLVCCLSYFGRKSFKPMEKDFVECE